MWPSQAKNWHTFSLQLTKAPCSRLRTKPQDWECQNVHLPLFMQLACRNFSLD